MYSRNLAADLHLEPALGVDVMTAIAARLAKDESGATSIEYALMAGIIALGIIVSVSSLTPVLNGFFNNVSTNLSK